MNPDDLPIKLVPSRFTSSVEQWKKEEKKKKKYRDLAIFVSRMMKPRIFSSVADVFLPLEARSIPLRLVSLSFVSNFTRQILVQSWNLVEILSVM